MNESGERSRERSKYKSEERKWRNGRHGLLLKTRGFSLLNFSTIWFFSKGVLLEEPTYACC